MRDRFLLLNPPGRQMYLRDYYCSSIAKADYYWHPGDLLIQSGILEERYEVFVIDAIAESLTEHDCRRKIEAIAPRFIYFLTSAASWQEDFRFVGSLPAEGFFASGELFVESASTWLEQVPWLTGILRDFTTRDILHFLGGRFDAVCRMTYRKDGRVIEVNNKDSRVFEIPVPAHEKFIGRYRMPFSRHKRFASLLTDHGCPHRCAFCNSWVLGYKRRQADNIAPELAHIARMGTRQLFVKDMSFCAHKAHADEVLSLLSGYAFDWHCYARAGDLTPELLARMKQTGCFLVQLGIEHVDPELLQRQNKHVDPAHVGEMIRTCGKLGIQVGAHFILGLPGESEVTLRALEEFLADFEADYVSINFAAPRFGSPLRKELIHGRRLIPDRHEVSQSPPSWSDIPAEVLQRARGRMVRRFYGRAGYILRQLKNVHSFHGLLGGFRNGADLMKQTLLSKKA